MPQTLSKQEIKQRLIRLRNVEALHEAQRFKIWNLRDENRLLRKELKELKSISVTQQQTINDLKVQVEELRLMVFGKKRKKQENDDAPPSTPPATSKPRTTASYRRKLPAASEITETKDHSLNACVHCHGTLSQRTAVTYFEEDIPLPQKKTVVKHIVEKGYCPSCKTWSAADALPTADVIIGTTAQRYVVYLSVVARQSYAQIQDVLHQTYDFTISQGEIAKILEREGRRLRPEYERLKATIRGEPSVHLDETGWNLFIGDKGYAWTMTGGISGQSIFVLGKTRGKGNAHDLLGGSPAVVVSDDYGAYRKLQNPHQLCCAHILRKLRDLATSAEIIGSTHDHCITVYHRFAGIYADIETARISSVPMASYATLLERLRRFGKPHALDPAKLSRVRAQIALRSQNYLTCFRYPGVVYDNN